MICSPLKTVDRRVVTSVELHLRVSPLLTRWRVYVATQKTTTVVSIVAFGFGSNYIPLARSLTFSA